MTQSRKTFLLTALAAAALPAAKTFATETLEKPTSDMFQTLMDATMANDYDKFLSVCDDKMKAALSKQNLEGVSAQFTPRAKDGYDADYFGELNQRKYAVHLWRLRFKSGGDDVLATMSVKDGRVGGFFLR